MNRPQTPHWLSSVATHAGLQLALPTTPDLPTLRSAWSQVVTQYLPVIVVSTSPDPQVEIDVLEAGADDYMTKPVPAERVEARVRAVLRRSGVELS